MTDLLGGAGQSEIWIDQDDKRNLSIWYMRPYYSGVETDLTDVQGQVGDRTTGWWPGPSGLNGDAGDVNPIYGVWYCRPDLTRGTTQQFGIVGVTRDIYGSPLGGVTVTMYLTATDQVVARVVSDPLGNYTITTPYYPNTHYMVFYRAGSPDVFATSPNTLIAG